MAGEDGRVLEAFSRLGAGARALLVLAPRHPERWDAVAEATAGAGLTLMRRSALALADTARRAPTWASGETSAAPPRPDVLLLDSLGELAGLYRLAAAAFIGGTLVPTGGHNPLEAACWGTPVAVGPSMENFRQIAEEFDRREALGPGGRRARSWRRLWRRWLAEPDEARRIGERGRRLIEANRGALRRDPPEMLAALGGAESVDQARSGRMRPCPCRAPDSARSRPWQRLYGAAHRARRAWWRDRAARLPRRVISIGNLCWGGSGKTPLTAAVAAHLGGRGEAVAILSRGYRSRRRRGAAGLGRPARAPEEASAPRPGGGRGRAVAAGAPAAGGVGASSAPTGPPRRATHWTTSIRPPICSCSTTASPTSGWRATSTCSPFPVDDPFGGGRLAPAGRLREPLASAAAADAVLLTGGPDRIAPGDGAALARALAPFGFRGEGFIAPIRPLPAETARRRGARRRNRGASWSPASPGPRGSAGRRRRWGSTCSRSCAFGDHHAYPARSLQRIARAARASGAAAVVTTAKDLVKLSGPGTQGDRLPVPLAEIPVACEPEPAFFDWLDRRLDRILDRLRDGTAAASTTGESAMKDAPVRHLVEYAAYLAVKGVVRALPHTAARSAGRADRRPRLAGARPPPADRRGQPGPRPARGDGRTSAGGSPAAPSSTSAWP